MKRFDKSFYLQTGIIVVLILIVSAAIFFSFYQDSSQQLLEHTGKDMQQISEQNASRLSGMIENSEKNMALVALGLSENSLELIKEKLKNLQTEGLIEEYYVADTEGIVYNASGNHQDIRDAEYFQNALKGNSGVSDSMISPFTEKNSIFFYHPLYIGIELEAVLIGSCKLEYLERQIVDLSVFSNPSNLGSEIKSWIVNAEGTVLASVNDQNTGKNLWEYFQQNQLIENSLVNYMKSDFILEENGGWNRRDIGVYYEPLSVNGWMLVQQIPGQISSDLESGIWTAYGKMMLKWIIVICMLMAAFYYLMRRKHAQLWHYYRHMKKVMQHLPEMLIEYNLSTQSMESYGSCERYSGISQGKMSRKKLLDSIYEQDREIFLKVYHQVLADSSETKEARETELRVCNDEGDYEWLLLSLSVIRDKRKNPISILILVHNIENYKENEIALLQHQNRLSHAIRLSGDTYYEILYIDLQKDCCEILKSPEEENVSMMQYQKYYTYWTEVFAEENVYEEDRAEFIRKMSAHHIRKEFARNMKYESFRYRRKKENCYKWVQVDCMPAPEYGVYGDIVILYVKNIDNQNQNLTF